MPETLQAATINRILAEGVERKSPYVVNHPDGSHSVAFADLEAHAQWVEHRIMANGFAEIGRDPDKLAKVERTIARMSPPDNPSRKEVATLLRIAALPDEKEEA